MVGGGVENDEGSGVGMKMTSLRTCGVFQIDFLWIFTVEVHEIESSISD
jgi:hypothetical protein